MKRQQTHAVAGGAFRKDGQHVARAQALGHVVYHAHGVTPRCALNEQRAGTGGKPANDGPALHVGLGDKAAVAGCMHHHNVQPRNMVGRQQHRPLRWRRANHY